MRRKGFWTGRSVTLLSAILIALTLLSCEFSGKSTVAPPEVRKIWGEAGESVDAKVKRMTGSSTPSFRWILKPKEDEVAR